MATPTLGSILLGTSDGDRLRAWYRAALAPTETRDGFLSFGGVEILVDGRTDLASVDPEPGRVILNFHVDDARATAAHLTEVGVSWLVELEEREAGLFATLLDPDGNYVQIVELARSEPGFKDEPDCFMVDTYELDEDVWVGGFVSIDQVLDLLASGCRSMGKTVPRTVLDAAKSARPSGRNMAQIHLARTSVQSAGRSPCLSD